MIALLVLYPSPAHSAAGSTNAAGGDPKGQAGTDATQPASAVSAALPDFDPAAVIDSVERRPIFHTIARQKVNQGIQDYVVEKGDSVFGIAKYFKISPETLLWANYDVLNDNPDMVSLGVKLKIPPVNGVLYQWHDGDKLEDVAARYKAKVDDILLYPGNNLDMTDPRITPGDYIMIPGGSREIRTWIVPTIPRGPAGVLKTVLGPGGCDTSATGGLGGTGSFVWPAPEHFLSGNDYWSGHLGLDIAAGLGESVFAADSGLVVYAGMSYGGYGNMVMIDHGNGYQTLYGHLSVILVRCGQSVSRGSRIGSAGSTGNSTGAHLHFEVRYMGGFINPWTVLP